ncbi:MAG: hypothetical protein WKG07_26630 [Hymenobacter sp.]
MKPERCARTGQKPLTAHRAPAVHPRPRQHHGQNQDARAAE